MFARLGCGRWQIRCLLAAAGFVTAVLLARQLSVSGVRGICLGVCWRMLFCERAAVGADHPAAQMSWARLCAGKEYLRYTSSTGVVPGPR
jgi:hypothetical protein